MGLTRLKAPDCNVKQFMKVHVKYKIFPYVTLITHVGFTLKIKPK